MCNCQQGEEESSKREQTSGRQHRQPKRTRHYNNDSGVHQRRGFTRHSTMMTLSLTWLSIMTALWWNPTAAAPTSSGSASSSSSSSSSIFSSTTTPTTMGPAPRAHTRLSGYGSSRHKYPRTTHSPSSPCLLLEQTDQGMFVTHQDCSDGKDGNYNTTTIFVPRATPDGLPDAQVVVNTNTTTTTSAATAVARKTNRTTAVHVEALVGVYTLPSGHVWVWIAQSKPVYSFPHFKKSKSPPRRRPLLDIRKVEQLYMVHVPFAAAATTTSSSSSNTVQQQQRQEQTRQCALWRQAWKDHDWYFCHKSTVSSTTTTTQSAAPIIPDLTRSMQAFFARNATTSALLFANDENNSDDASATAVQDMSNNTVTNTTKEAVIRTTMAASVAVATEQPEPLPWYNSSSPLYPDSRFFWNEPVLIDALPWQTNAACRQLVEWAVPITSAFCGIQTNVTAEGRKSGTTHHYDHVLISRRSRWRAGTRFTKRGADAVGRVANYAETEQLILTRTRPDKTNGSAIMVQSHVQIRGSIPLRWSSPTDIKTYRPRVYIGTDPVAQARSLQLHLAEQFVHYVPKIVPTNDGLSTKKENTLASLVLVNLVDRKSDQGRLGQALDAVLDAVLDVYSQRPDERIPVLNKQGVRHVWFDFHAELKGGRWDKLQSLLKDLNPALEQHGYFQATKTKDGEWKVEKWQTGVMRTNCMDCLDRTNVVQGIIARRMLVSQLSRSVPNSYKTLYRKNPLTLPWSEGEKAHRLLWADNADAISRLYAGTPALKGDFTRTGKRTRKGALDDGMNSLQRYYLNNFLDADRQEGIDLLTCHEDFNRLDEADQTMESENNGDASRVGGLNLRDAARELLLGATWQDVMKKNIMEDESDHVRIKVSSKSKRREFGLLWLPGDLQTQMRELISTPVADSIPDELSSEHVLRAMDKRASSEIPWWIQAAWSSDDSDADEPSATRRDTDSTSSSPGFMLAALVAASQAPLGTAAFILTLVGASSFNS